MTRAPESFSSTELLALLGFPARLAGRIPLVARYIWKNFPSQSTSRYAEVRFGKSWRWRPWLILDLEALEYIEDLLNEGDDKKVTAYREAQLNNSNSVGVMVSTSFSRRQLSSTQSTPPGFYCCFSRHVRTEPSGLGLNTLCLPRSIYHQYHHVSPRRLFRHCPTTILRICC